MNCILPKNQFIILAFWLSAFSLNVNSQVTISGQAGFPVGSSMSGVAYGNGVYVTVGSSGYILKSTNGTKWSVEKTSSFINTSYTRVTYGNSLFVAITSDGKIVTSPDGSAWTQQVSGTANYLNDIIYANGIFLVVGNNNTALSSTDGLTWTSVSIGAASADLLLSIAYSGSKFVVGVRDNATSGSKSFYSATGASGTWSNVTIVAGNSLNRISYLNNKFFCYTINTNIYSSSDGISWTAFVNSRLTTTNQIFHGFYDGSKYYMFGSSAEYGYGSVFTSTDGTTFSLQSQTTTIVAQYSTYVNGRYFQVGNEGLVSSSDGSNWSFPGGSYNAIASDGSRYVVVGQTTSSEAALFTSTDFSNWTNVAPGVIKPLNGIVYGNSKYVAVGNVDASGFGTIVNSSDGISWTASNSGVADNLKAVAYGGGKFVAVGLNGRIIYSSNGTSWTSAESVAGYNYYGVAFVNNYFVAVGGSTVSNTGMAKVKYSANGVIWTDVSPSIVGHFHGIAYGGGKYLIVGRDNTIGSQKFISITTSDITSSGGYSSAINVTTPEGDVGTLGFGGVAYNNSNFVAIVNLRISPFSAYVLNSANGSSWTATSASTTGRLRGIIASGSGFKVAGTLDTRLGVSVGSILPLKLLEFNGSRQSDLVSLHWTTTNEINIAHFVVERSEDGNHFITLDTVNSKTPADNNQYQITDRPAIAGAIYYRLKIVDLDGKFSYSPVLKISDGGNSARIMLYPNPVSGSLMITLDRDKPWSLRLFDNRGTEILRRNSTGNSLVISFDQMPVGIYYVRIQRGSETYIRKIVKN